VSYPFESVFSFGTKKNVVFPPVHLDRDTAFHVQNNEWIEAIDALRELFYRHNADPNLKYYLSHAYKVKGLQSLKNHRYRQAIQDFQNGISVWDEDPELHLSMGISYLALSEYQNAERSLDQALWLAPDNYLAHLKIGELYYLINNPKLAEYHWQTALRINPLQGHLKKRLESLQSLMTVSRGFEVEANRFFSVSFDGEQNPELKYIVLEILKDAHYEIGKSLFLYPKRQVAVVLLTRMDFKDITGSPKWASGLYEGQIKVPVSGYNINTLKTILYHEYVHAVIFDLMSDRCPWWLNEGLAQYFSEDNKGNSIKKKIARNLIIHNKNVPSLENLPGNFLNNKNTIVNAYALAISAVDFFLDEFNFFNLHKILNLMANGVDIDTALKECTGFSLEQFENFWYATVASR
jgi:tetratricopeptide (TPR) repeat protein